MRRTLLVGLLGAMLVLRSASGIPKEWWRGPAQQAATNDSPPVGGNAVVGVQVAQYVDVGTLVEAETEDNGDEETDTSEDAAPETANNAVVPPTGGKLNPSKPVVQADGKWPSHHPWGHKKGNWSEEERQKFHDMMIQKLMPDLDARKVVQLLNVTCGKLRTLPVGEYDDLVAGTNRTKLQHFVMGFLKELANVTGFGKHHEGGWPHQWGHKNGTQHGAGQWQWGKEYRHDKNCTQQHDGKGGWGKDKEDKEGEAAGRGHGGLARKDREDAAEASGSGGYNKGGRGDKGQGGEGRDRGNNGGRGDEGEEGRGRGNGGQGGKGKDDEGAKGERGPFDVPFGGGMKMGGPMGGGNGMGSPMGGGMGGTGGGMGGTGGVMGGTGGKMGGTGGKMGGTGGNPSTGNNKPSNGDKAVGQLLDGLGSLSDVLSKLQSSLGGLGGGLGGGFGGGAGSGGAGSSSKSSSGGNPFASLFGKKK